MRRTKTQWIRFLSLVAILGILVCGVLVVTQVVPDYRASGSETVETQWTLPIGQGENIHIDVSSIHVRLETHGGKDAEIRFTGTQRNMRTQEVPELIVETTRNGLEISEKRSTEHWQLNLGPFNYSSLSGELVVLVPDEEFGEIQVGTFSGNITVQNLEARTIALDASSGKIESRNLEADQEFMFTTFSGTQTHTGLQGGTCEIDTSSASVTVRDSDLRSLSVTTFSGTQTLSGVKLDQALALDSSSGRIDVDMEKVDRATVHTFSGSVTLQAESIEDLGIDTSSGKVDVALRDEPEKVSVETFSGSVQLKLPEDSEFTYTVDTFSGRVQVDFPHTQREDGGVVGDGKNSIELNTSSGDIRISPI